MKACLGRSKEDRGRSSPSLHTLSHRVSQISVAGTFSYIQLCMWVPEV